AASHIAEWLMFHQDYPGGISRAQPGAAEAMRTHFDGVELGSNGRHADAVTTLEKAKTLYAREGFPVLAMRLNLALADNLLRLGRLQQVFDALDEFDREYIPLCTEPLSESFVS